MSQRNWVDPRISQVRAEQMRGYMLDHGWKLQPYPRRELLVFGGQVDDDGLPILQVLPASEHLHDFLMRLEELLSSLSALENRHPGDILSDVLRYPAGPPVPPESIEVANLSSTPE